MSIMHMLSGTSLHDSNCCIVQAVTCLVAVPLLWRWVAALG